MSLILLTPENNTLRVSDSELIEHWANRLYEATKRRKWGVEFYFTECRSSGVQVLFRSESMPREQAESVMDSILALNPHSECWLQDLGPADLSTRQDSCHKDALTDAMGLEGQG